MQAKFREPWFDIWKKFGWKPGTWAVGINSDLAKLAVAKGEKLEILMGKFGNFEVDPQAVIEYSSHEKTQHIASIKKLYYVIPFNMLKKVGDNRRNQR